MQKNKLCNLCLNRVAHRIATLTFDSANIEKPGSQPIAKHTYRFTSENGKDFILPCISDSGNARTLVAQDILDDNAIDYFEAAADEHLTAPNGTDMHISGCLLLQATFKENTIMVDALVSDDISGEVIVSCYDSNRIGAISIAEDDWPSSVSLVNAAKICAMYKGVPPNTTMSEEDIKKKIDFWCKKFSCIRDKLSETNSLMKGPPMIIRMKDNVPDNPPKSFTAATVPRAYDTPAKNLFTDLQEGGQIEKVPLSHKSKFCSRAFIVPKGGHISNGARLVVDFSPYCKYIMRPVHTFTPGTDLLKKLDPSAVVFAKMDCLQGYFQIPLAEESRDITTFVSPYGTFRYCVAPMGVPSSSDEYNRRSDDALAGLEGVHKLVDDILVVASNYEELFARVEAVLTACEENNITLKYSKFQMGNEVTFSGFLVSNEGIKPTEERIECIKNYPVPENRTKLKGFLGTARYIGHFVPDLAMAEKPLRKLDRDNVPFIWNSDHQAAFELVKSILTGPLVLRNFDSTRPTRLETDASRQGLGFGLLQEDPISKNWHLIQCGSRALTDPESRYAVCELEMLAICWSLIKCRHWVLGYEGLEVVTDHSALVQVFTKDCSAIINPRLRRFRERCMEFQFHVTWRKGILNELADLLSRTPIWPANDELEDPDYTHVCNLIRSEFSDPLIDKLVLAGNQDPNYRKLKEAMRTFKKASKIPKNHPAKHYSRKWRELSFHASGLIVCELTRIVPPEASRKDILNKFHDSHCGIEKLQKLAKQRFYWPGLNNSLEQIVKECGKCQYLLPSHPMQPVKVNTKASYPMSDVATDLFQIGSNDYIALVDRYSGWPMCAKLRSKTTESVISVLYEWYTTWGWPARQFSDGGPQYRSQEMASFCKDVIDQDFSSPGYANGNGLAENAVKQVKYLLLKLEENWVEFQYALQEWRNTPSHTGYAPSQIFLNRVQRTKLPVLPELCHVNTDNAALGATAKKVALKVKAEKLGGKVLQELVPGQRVLVQQLKGIGRKPRWDNSGTIVNKNGDHQSYFVDLDTGERLLRNRIYLRELSESPDILKEEFIHECVAPRRSERIAARMNQ